MQRKTLVLFLVVLVLGFIAGYAMFMYRPHTVAKNDVQHMQAVDTIPGYASGVILQENVGTQPGWCCNKPGSPCDATDGSLICLRGGGLVFDGNRSRCDNICSAAGKM
jgi:hypothetical protein